MSNTKSRKHAHHPCPNCDAAVNVEDKFCSHCGQSTHDLNIPLKHFLKDALEDLFHFEGKSIHTMKALLGAPGKLTLEFIHGKRARYVAPLRFYIFISVVFFFTLSLPKGASGTDSTTGDVSANIGVSFRGIQSSELNNVAPSQIDSVLSAHAVEPTTLHRYVLRQMQRMQTEGREQFLHTVFKGLSYMMFVLMPLFGWFVYLLYRSTTRHYMSGLVFSFHYHSFVFVLLIVLTLASRWDNFGWAPLLVLVASPIYLMLALRRVFGGSMIHTVLKTGILGILQLAALAVLFLATVSLSLLLF